jgi:hypothetical protein
LRQAFTGYEINCTPTPSDTQRARSKIASRSDRGLRKSLVKTILSIVAPHRTIAADFFIQNATALMFVIKAAKVAAL